MASRRWSAAVAGSLLLATVGCGQLETAGSTREDTFPSEPITLLVVNPPGSAPDSNARALATSLEAELAGTVVIKNVPGAAGMVGLAELAGADPDGYTLAYAASNNLTSQPQLVDTAFTGPEMVQPIGQVAEIPAAVFVNSSSDIQDVEDLVAAAKARPGQIKLGIPAVTSIQNVQLEIFAQQAGVSFDKVATGAGQQVIPVVNGSLEAGVVQPGPILQYVQKGDLRIVGILGEQVPEGLDAPSFADAGYGSDYLGYEGVVAPTDLPQDRLAQLEEALEAAVLSEQFQDYMRSSYGIPAFLGADEYGQRLTDDVENNARYIEEFDLKAEG